MEDKLTEINQNDLPILRNIYKPDNSGRYITYVLIDTYMNWLQQDRNIKYLHFYCLNNDFSNGTIVVFVSVHIKTTITCETLQCFQNLF